MADTIRVLIATDNHVGYAERDPIRGDDSWRTFHEVMCLAKEKDVDMVLLGGDLFHENKPSRKSMYNVMRSLRLNCYGDKPCELELLSDGSLHFDSTIGHANYEDPDINVAIPVFSIHGNHDDPSGEGLYAALDILEMAGLINYFGRVPESDNITIRPLFFQKGNTKLALYGLSNVRDERLHRTFRDEKVVFKRPGTQTSDWFNLMCVHQNHHAHTETSYLPENQLPDYMDLIVWGHEHECDMIAHKNPEKGFRVLQPGSSVATSLVPGEAQPKHVFILNVTGRQFKLDPIRLKTVRPFVYKDIVLSQEKEALRIAKKNDHRSELTRYLEKIVHGLIEQARQEWEEAQGLQDDDEDGPAVEYPLPIVRLRVETTSPDGGVTKFDTENPQRFSNRFSGRVANRNDVIQFHARKKANSTRAAANTALDEETLSKYETETVRVKDLVADFLNAQSLSILPTNYFSEAVTDYITKDDKYAMELFVNESLANQIKHLVSLHDDEDDADIQERLEQEISAYRQQLEELFSKGKIKKGSAKFKPKPDNWNSDWDGHWEEQPSALITEVVADDQEDNDEGEDGVPASRSGAGRGRGRGRGGRMATQTIVTRGRGRGATKSATAASRSRKQPTHENEDDEDEDVVMVDDEEDEEDDSQALFIPEGTRRSKPTVAPRGRTTATKAAAPSARKPPARSTTTSRSKQATLNFSQSQATSSTRATNGSIGRRTKQVTEDISDDDDDAFEPATAVKGGKK